MQSDGRKGRDTYLRSCTRCFGSLDADELIYLLLANLHRPGGPCSRAAVNGWDASVACAHVSLHMACAVNGIHIAGLTVTGLRRDVLEQFFLLGCMLHDDGWPHDHALGALG